MLLTRAMLAVSGIGQQEGESEMWGKPAEPGECRFFCTIDVVVGRQL